MRVQSIARGNLTRRGSVEEARRIAWLHYYTRLDVGKFDQALELATTTEEEQIVRTSKRLSQRASHDDEGDAWEDEEARIEAAVRVQAIVRGHATRESIEEERRITWLKYLMHPDVADFKQALELTATPLEVRAVRAAQAQHELEVLQCQQVPPPATVEPATGRQPPALVAPKLPRPSNERAAQLTVRNAQPKSREGQSQSLRAAALGRTSGSPPSAAPDQQAASLEELEKSIDVLRNLIDPPKDNIERAEEQQSTPPGRSSLSRTAESMERADVLSAAMQNGQMLMNQASPDRTFNSAALECARRSNGSSPGSKGRRSKRTDREGKPSPHNSEGSEASPATASHREKREPAAHRKGLETGPGLRKGHSTLRLPDELPPGVRLPVESPTSRELQFMPPRQPGLAQHGAAVFTAPSDTVKSIILRCCGIEIEVTRSRTLSV